MEHVAVPPSGRLLFFFFDGTYDDHAGVVSPYDPASAAGARVLHLPDDVPCRPRPAPDHRVPRLREQRCTARVVLTFPCDEVPAVRRAVDPRGLPDDPIAADAFADARWDWPPEPRHQVGGHPHAAQGPVEADVATAALHAAGPPVTRDAVAAEASRWSLLLQVDSDAAIGAMWDDCGTLAWFTRDGDPTVHGFAWQSA